MNVSMSIPEEIYKKAAEVARAQQIPIDDVFASAVAEQLSAWDRLQQRAARITLKRRKMKQAFRVARKDLSYPAIAKPAHAIVKNEMLSGRLCSSGVHGQ